MGPQHSEVLSIVPSEATRSPLRVDRASSMVLEIFDHLPADTQIALYTHRETRTYRLQQQGLEISIDRPSMPQGNSPNFPSSSDTTTATITQQDESTQEAKIRAELELGVRDGLSKIYIVTDDGTIMDQHVDDLTSEAQQEAFRKYGVTVAQWLADVLFAGKWLDPPYPRTTISELSMDSINEKPKPQLSRPEITGDKYFKASAYDPVIANNLPELGNFSGPIPDR